MDYYFISYNVDSETKNITINQSPIQWLKEQIMAENERVEKDYKHQEESVNKHPALLIWPVKAKNIIINFYHQISKDEYDLFNSIK